MRGKIRRMVSDRGFMFVRSVDGGDYWCHVSECKKIDFNELAEGIELEFDPFEHPEKGLQGKNVRYPEVPDTIEKYLPYIGGHSDPDY